MDKLKLNEKYVKLSRSGLSLTAKLIKNAIIDLIKEQKEFMNNLPVFSMYEIVIANHLDVLKVTDITGKYIKEVTALQNHFDFNQSKQKAV